MTNKEFTKELLYSLKNFPEDWEGGSRDEHDVSHKHKNIRIIEVYHHDSIFDKGLCCLTNSGVIYFNFCTRRKLRKAIKKMKRNNIINNLYHETN